ncbi:cyclophilin-like fold protein [Amaricoccus sp. W119]|uniref:cyclophilin-like fold protein n=1 Tax=Amaricoccus sp. W119 TaxID=3391833 RepID=UPI0039A5F549
MRIRCQFADQVFTCRLLDNPTARDLVSLLPLDLTIEDFSTNEKIAHLPRRLDESGRVPIEDETPGDLCYFLGWGNLAFFHGDYRYRNDLIRLGRIEGGVAPLLVKGTFPLSIGAEAQRGRLQVCLPSARG